MPAHYVGDKERAESDAVVEELWRKIEADDAEIDNILEVWGNWGY